MKKIKILSLCTSSINYNRGTPIRIKNFLSNLLKYEDVSLILYSADKKKPLDLLHHCLSDSFYKNLLEICQDIRESKIDIVIGHTLTSYKYMLLIKLFTGVKIVLDMHGFIEEEALLCKGIGKIHYLRNKILYAFAYGRFNLIITSSATATNILSQYNRNVVTIFGGADVGLFNPNVSPGNYIRKNKGEIIIGYAGNARPWQGLDFLLETYAELRRNHRQFRLAILMSEKWNFDKQEGVEFFSEIDHELVPEFLADCDILVIPRPENVVNRISFPSKLVEYMAMGRPVISSRTGDADHIITQDISGLLYAPGDKEGFKTQLLKLVEKAKREMIGQEAHEKVRASLTWEKQTTILINELRKLFKS